MKKWIVVLLCLFVVGCQKGVDPETGRETYRVDQNSVITLEKQVETGVSLLALAGSLWPALLPIAGAAAGVLGTSRKIKPNLTEAQHREAIAYSIALSSVQAIDEFKATNPEKWAELESKYFVSIIGPEAENVIRAIRGLPPKVL